MVCVVFIVPVYCTSHSSPGFCEYEEQEHTNSRSYCVVCVVTVDNVVPGVYTAMNVLINIHSMDKHIIY